MVEMCLHIHDLQHAKPLWKKFRSLESRFEKYTISVPEKVVEQANDLFGALRLNVPYTVIGVENRYNDWSGYLALLRESKSSKLILCNDSVISRRFILHRDFQRLLDLLLSANRPCIIGELDTAKVSVPVNGRSSPCWISSYLFGLNIGDSPALQMATQLESLCENMSDQTNTFFLEYLGEHRKDLLKDDPRGGGKIVAMHLERLMTDYAIQNEFDIVSMYGGDWNRKVRKLVECVKSA